MTRLDYLEWKVASILRDIHFAEATGAPPARIKSLIRAHREACRERNSERAAVMASQADIAWSGGSMPPKT